MSEQFRCPSGHQWAIGPTAGALAMLDGLLCPQCGAAAESRADVGATGQFPTVSAPPPVPDIATPVQVPGYEVVGELGRGGMGVVYRARHLRLKRPVALKMIRADARAGPNEVARFRTEAEAAARLQHPNIVQIYEVGECTPADGSPRPYMALEFVPGESLDRKLRCGLPAPTDAAALVATLADALQFAHDHQVVHRDLKPANVLMSTDGTPKVADFGLARQLDADSRQTQTGAILGTPSYMAPEQARGDLAAVGPSADVWALGAILYECLTGRPPFKGASLIETLELVRSADPLPPGRVAAGVPRDLDTICLKCLRKDPADRYLSAAALADDLRRFTSGEPVAARPEGRARRHGERSGGGHWCPAWRA